MRRTKEIFGTEFPVFLAPMAGVTDLPFRLLCKEQGCDAMVTEMVSAKALYYGNKNTAPLLETREEERPIGVQLFGSDPELMGQMAHKIEGKGFSFIDINMGCPVPKIVNNREGSALMKDEKLAEQIINAVSKSVAVPITIKMRMGWDFDHLNAPKIAKIAEDAGIKTITIHCRTRSQLYSGQADWSFANKIREVVKLPIIVNRLFVVENCFCTILVKSI